MDWMYDGVKIQKEDYLLGKKVDKHLNESMDNGNFIRQIYLHLNLRYYLIFSTSVLSIEVINVCIVVIIYI